jgi:hypothetical protein
MYEINLQGGKRDSKKKPESRPWSAKGALCITMALGIALSSLMLGHLRAQKRGNLLSVSVEVPKADSLPKTQNPAHALSLLKIQQLLLEVAQSPRDRKFVEESLKETEFSVQDILDMGLLKEQDSQCVLGFSLFTQDDQRRLREICKNFAEDLAETYYKRYAEYQEILNAYPQKKIDTPALAYVLIGCFSLDWDGLRVTRELGYRPSTPPENAPFIGWADDRRAKEFREKKGLYWGSHNEYLNNGMAFTTFGDHSSLLRYGFPDIAWQMIRSIRLLKAHEDIQSVLGRIGRRALYEEMLIPLGDIMMELRNGKRSEEEIRDATGIESGPLEDLLTILENLEYVWKVSDGYEVRIPVFSPNDQSFIHKLIITSREMLTSWLKQNFTRLKSELSDLSAYKYGQPLEATFYKIWHEIFGAANRILVEKGMFFDPYGGSRKYEGYLPVVWHMSVARDLR